MNFQQQEIDAMLTIHIPHLMIHPIWTPDVDIYQISTLKAHWEKGRLHAQYLCGLPI